MSERAFSFGRLHHVLLAIPAGGEDASRQFWGGVLGMAEIDKPSSLAGRGGCWFRSGEVEVHLGVESDFAAAKKAHPGILISGLELLAWALSAAGGEVI